jgi:hypothetical protein
MVLVPLILHHSYVEHCLLTWQYNPHLVVVVSNIMLSRQNGGIKELPPSSAISLKEEEADDRNRQ